jgi:hypothetical protein
MQAAILVPALRPTLNPQFPALQKWYEAMETPALQAIYSRFNKALIRTQYGLRTEP